MIKKALIFAVTAASLATGASAFAQSDYRTDRSERYERSDRYDRSDRNNRYEHSRDYRHHRGDRYSRNDRDGYVQRDYRYNRAPQVQYNYTPQVQYGYSNDQYRGVRQHQWQRGQHLSSQYRGNRYVVSDWRRHQNLYAPQHGYQWVQNGNDFLMVAIASGLIAHVLLGN